MKFIISSLICLFFIGCSSTDNKNKSVNSSSPVLDTVEQISSLNYASVQPNTLVSLNVSGMMCLKGCGSSIRKGLYQAGGVSKVEISDFNATDSINNVQVYFDNSVISSEKITKVIHTIADGRYAASIVSSHSFQP